MRVVFDLVRVHERDLVRRRFEIALAVSLVLHALALWQFLAHEPLKSHGDRLAKAEEPLSLRIVPQTPTAAQAPQARAVEAPPAPAIKAPPRRVVPRPAPAPPVISAPAPSPIPAPPPRPPEPAPPAPAPPPIPVSPPQMMGDMSSYIAERRRARGETGDAASTVDSESARRDRAIAANLASMQTQTFGELPHNGGGTFQIRRMDYQDAQFTFYGWNRDINRRAFQVIDVRKGDNATINLAIVRKIISIIREYEPGDFHWESKRLGRDMTLSARPADNAELEAFMMTEFFNDVGQPR